MMIEQFTYNEKKSYDDFGLIITETPEVEIPERDISFISVPGRSGDIITDNGRFKNVNVKYKVSALCNMKDLPAVCRDIAAWLYPDIGGQGYYKLSDTYDSDYFRYAAISGSIPFESKLNKIGNATLTFNCKPFKYSEEGQKGIVLDLENVNYYENPEKFASRPIFRLYGNGTITLFINDYRFVFDNVDKYIDIDAENMIVYKNQTNMSQNMTGNWDELILLPGINEIVLNGENISRAIAIGQWRTL